MRRHDGLTKATETTPTGSEGTAIERGGLTPLVEKTRELTWVAASVLGVSVAMATAWAWTSVKFGSPLNALKYAQGSRLIVEPELLDIGTGGTGETKQGTIVVTNLSNQPALIQGATQTCTCLTMEQLPFVIPAGEARRLRISLRFDEEQANRVSQAITLFTDSVANPRLRIRVCGASVKEPALNAKGGTIRLR